MRRSISTMLRVRGLTAPVFTPLFDNGDVNFDGISTYAQHLAQHQVSNLFVGGTSSEFPSFSVNERKAINQKWITEGKKHLSGHVIVHVGTTALCDAQELAKHAVESGADAVASVPPFYLTPQSLDSMVAYFKQLSQAVPHTPFLYYHFPGLTKCPIDLIDFVGAALKEIPTFIGLKYTDDDMEQLKAMRLRFGDDIQIFNGFDYLNIEAMKMGIFEGIGATFSFMPGPYLRMKKAIENHDMVSAQKEANFVNEVFGVMQKNSKNGLTAGLKDFARATGLEVVGKTRLPLISSTADVIAQIRTDLEQIDFFNQRF